MGQLITASIDVTKIDKDRLVAGKDGKPKYLNLTIWVNDEEDNYGNNVSVQHSQSQQERQSNAPKIYLGNGKTWNGGGGGGGQARPTQQQAPAQQASTQVYSNDDIAY